MYIHTILLFGTLVQGQKLIRPGIIAPTNGEPPRPVVDALCPTGQHGPVDCNGVKKCLKPLSGFFANPNVVSTCSGSSKVDSICPTSYPYYDTSKAGCVKSCLSGTILIDCNGKKMCFSSGSIGAITYTEYCQTSKICPTGFAEDNVLINDKYEKKCVNQCSSRSGLASKNCGSFGNICLEIFESKYTSTCPNSVCPDSGHREVGCVESDMVHVLCTEKSPFDGSVLKCPKTKGGACPIGSIGLEFIKYAELDCRAGLRCYPVSATNDLLATDFCTAPGLCPVGFTPLECPSLNKTVCMQAVKDGDATITPFCPETKFCPTGFEARTCNGKTYCAKSLNGAKLPICSNSICPTEKPILFSKNECSSSNCPAGQILLNCTSNNACVTLLDGTGSNAVQTCPSTLNNCPVGYAKFDCGLTNITCLKIKDESSRIIGKCPSTAPKQCPFGFSVNAAGDCGYICAQGSVYLKCDRTSSTGTCLTIYSGNFSLEEAGLTSGYVASCPSGCPYEFHVPLTCNIPMCSNWVSAVPGTNVLKCPQPAISTSPPINCPLGAAGECVLDGTCATMTISTFIRSNNIETANLCPSGTCPKGFSPLKCNNYTNCVSDSYSYKCFSGSCPTDYTKVVMAAGDTKACQSVCTSNEEYLVPAFREVPECFKKAPPSYPGVLEAGRGRNGNIYHSDLGYYCPKDYVAVIFADEKIYCQARETKDSYRLMVKSVGPVNAKVCPSLIAELDGKDLKWNKASLVSCSSKNDMCSTTNYAFWQPFVSHCPSGKCPIGFVDLRSECVTSSWCSYSKFLGGVYVDVIC